MAAKRKATDLEIPESGEDPEERKRVLNVLAQRRYRQRKKEKLERLEEQAKGREDTASIPKSRDGSQRERQRQRSTSEQSPLSQDQNQDHNEPLVQHGDFLTSDSTKVQSLYDFTAQPPTTTSTEPLPHNSRSHLQVNFNPYLSTSWFEGVDQGQLCSPSAIPLELFDPEVDHHTSKEFSTTWNFKLPSAPQTTSPLPSIDDIPTTTSSSENTSWSLTSVHPLGSTPRPNEELLNSQLQAPDFNPQYSFPDEGHLKSLELNVLNGALTIARSLDIDKMIWSLDATSPFTDLSQVKIDLSQLPPNLRPTTYQMSQPHHPVIDLLPWPSVRDKLILILSQPIDKRPAIAASETALLEFIYDLEDSAEGVRVWGGDPHEAKSWEVGQKMFENWWWAFDRDVIRCSNELRKARGAPRLQQGKVLGETE